MTQSLETINPGLREIHESLRKFAKFQDDSYVPYTDPQTCQLCAIKKVQSLWSYILSFFYNSDYPFLPCFLETEINVIQRTILDTIESRELSNNSAKKLCIIAIIINDLNEAIKGIENLYEISKQKNIPTSSAFENAANVFVVFKTLLEKRKEELSTIIDNLSSQINDLLIRESKSLRLLYLIFSLNMKLNEENELLKEDLKRKEAQLNKVFEIILSPLNNETKKS